MLEFQKQQEELETHSPPAPVKLNLPSPTASLESRAIPTVPRAMPVSTTSFQKYKIETSSYIKQEKDEEFAMEDDFAASGIDSPLKDAQTRWSNAVSQWKVLSQTQEKVSLYREAVTNKAVISYE